jgi:hypothetical protein
LIRKATQWGFINKKGTYEINPQFDGARSFENGLARVRKGTKWGFIDKSGTLVINPQFDNLEDFSK